MATATTTQLSKTTGELVEEIEATASAMFTQSETVTSTVFYFRVN